MGKPLDEQVVVITGASSGIGRETALRLADKGARVVVSARREEPLDDLAAQIKSQGGDAVSIPADVSVYEEVESLARDAVSTYGRIDTWVNNAGVLLVSEFEKADLGEARRVFDVNFWGEYHGCKAVLPVMKLQGSGTIINVTSVTAKRPLPLMSAYSASKAAINGLSESLRAELADSGVELCIVMPATIDTPLYEHARSKEGAAPKAAPPIYPPSEVAKAIEMCAVSPRRMVYAGPAGQMFAVSNYLAGGVLDKVLGAVRRPAILTRRPEAPRGEDNLERPMDEVPATPEGGWRTGRYKALDTVARVALGVTALFLARRLTRKT
jgi:NAD(P)-dependent dehydrogenase (short-subunit alcohol dehydrogenase family)